MRINAAGHPFANVPSLADTGQASIGSNIRPHEVVQHELPALARRVASAAQGTRPPERATLHVLLAATPRPCAYTAAPHPEAARVVSQVASGELMLHNHYEPADLRAAANLAASGLAALRRIESGS